MYRCLLVNRTLCVSSPQVVRFLKLKGKAVPSDYAESFERALHTFLHQRVFDLNLREVIPLTPFSDDVPQETRDIYVGPYVCNPPSPPLQALAHIMRAIT